MKKKLRKAHKLKKLRRNTGFNYEMELDHQNPQTDYILGAASQKCLAEIPAESRQAYLPLGEVQFGREDYMDCASRSPLNILETKMNYLVKNRLISNELILWLTEKKYLTERGVEFSDRWIAIKSKTTRSGNSLIAPIHACHEHGLIPKALLPANSNMTWDDYHNAEDITEEIEKLAKEWLTKFTINYEKVYAEQFENFYKRDSIATAGYAWPNPENGVYPRVDYGFNHAFMGGLDEQKHLVFDNYLDMGVEGDFIKKLAEDYNLINPSYRLVISLTKKKLTWLQLLRKFFKC